MEIPEWYFLVREFGYFEGVLLLLGFFYTHFAAVVDGLHDELGDFGLAVCRYHCYIHQLFFLSCPSSTLVIFLAHDYKKSSEIFRPI